MIPRITCFPLSIALLLFPSVKYILTLDGARAEYYGFPLPWNSNALATSLAKEIYLLPLLIDLAFFAILSAFAFRVMARHSPILKKAIPAIWILGLLSATSIALILSLGSFFQCLPNPGPFHVDRVTISIGL